MKKNINIYKKNWILLLISIWSSAWLFFIGLMGISSTIGFETSRQSLVFIFSILFILMSFPNLFFFPLQKKWSYFTTQFSLIASIYAVSYSFTQISLIQLIISVVSLVYILRKPIIQNFSIKPRPISLLITLIVDITILFMFTKVS